MLEKLERKIGKYAIPNLMSYLIGGYIIGYVLMSITPGILGFMTLEPYMVIHSFQFWRVITWVLIPPSRFGFFTIIMLIFYWQLGKNLESMWGTFKFNVYIIGGILITVIGAFAYFAIVYFTEGFELANMGNYFSTYYINMSIFLAFALTIPDMRIFLYFFIPIKMKWLAIVYAALISYSFLATQSVNEKVSIGCSLLNFIIFFLSTRRFRNISRGRSGGFNPNFGTRSQRTAYNAYNRQQAYSTKKSNGTGQKDTVSKMQTISRHKCSICGRTELTNPELEFRFCSKCNGNYEYCNEHLFNHQHVE